MPLLTALGRPRLRARERAVAAAAVGVLAMAIGALGVHRDAQPFVVGTTPPQQPFAAAGGTIDGVRRAVGPSPVLVEEQAVRFVADAEDLSLARASARTRDADRALALLAEYDAVCAAGYSGAMTALTDHLTGLTQAPVLPDAAALAPTAGPFRTAAAAFATCASYLADERSPDEDVQGHIDGLASVFRTQAAALEVAAGMVASPDSSWGLGEVGDAVAGTYDRLQEVHRLRLAVLDAVIAG